MNEARVGSRRKGNDEGDVFEGVLGPHGLGVVNEAGQQFLSFCASNQLAIMNTMFEKKNAQHKATWQHAGSKRWHCIDYVVMRQSQRRICNDVHVIRKADCWTDHQLLCAKLRFQPRKFAYHARKVCGREMKKIGKNKRRFAVYKLQWNKESKDEVYRFSGKLDQKLRRIDIEEGSMLSAAELCEAIKVALVESAEESIGRDERRQPEWFSDGLREIMPRIKARMLPFLCG